MKRRIKIKLNQLFYILCAWLFVGFFISLYDYLVLNTQFSLGPSDEYSFLLSVGINMGSALVGALTGGSLLVFYINTRFQNKPYGYTILAVLISYIAVIALIILLLGFITIPYQTDKSFFDRESIESFVILLTDTSRIKNIMLWSVVVALTQLFLQMNSKFGHGVFWNIIRGKYNTPKEESRIFMSLDLNSSTAMAERLGDEKYHELLKVFFADITNPVIDNDGEIYQYVGDEVIIAWKYEEGITNNRCIKCFFDMKMCIDKNKERYIQNYGLIPSFKAGIHWGKVVVGEIGVIKRDITYSGDVMNTTSRIRDKCKEFNVEMIASADLLSRLNLSKELIQNKYVPQNLGFIKLKGKEKEVMLSTLLPV